jgi:hypothetical protein
MRATEILIHSQLALALHSNIGSILQYKSNSSLREKNVFRLRGALQNTW